MIGLRPATAEDADAVARLFARTCRLSLPFLKSLHSPEEDFDFFSRAITLGSVTLAADGTALSGFLAESPGWIDHLYVAPETQGTGIGARLLGVAKDRQADIQLWCFARNTAARTFYERHGFSAVRQTAGDNEQGLPDILYRWRR